MKDNLRLMKKYLGNEFIKTVGKMLMVLLAALLMMSCGGGK